jgi:DNA-directed RNA polymerase subunit M/transcription elongation factor TFIIS
MTHKVSKDTVQAAQKHALQSLKHTEEIEELTQKLKTGHPAEQEQAKRIEPYLENLQEHSEEFMVKAQQLNEQDNSTETFVECVEEHVKATEAHIQVVKEFSKSSTHILSSKKKQSK